MKNESWTKAYKSLLTSKDLNAGELKTLLLIKLLGQEKYFWGSQSTIAMAAGISRQMVIRHFKSLAKNGFIEINKRLGRTSIISFTGKTIPVNMDHQDSKPEFTQLDEHNRDLSLSPSEKNQAFFDCFTDLTFQEPEKGEIDKWLDSFSLLLEKGLTDSNILRMIYYLSENVFWRKVILSPLDFFSVDKNGVHNYKRILVEAGEDPPI